MSEPLPDGISPLLFQAVTLHEQGNLDEAEKVYDRILAEDPHDANVLHFKGVIALSRSDFSSALDYLGKALCWNPRNGSFYSNLGEVYRHRGDNYTAVLAYNIALALDPALPMALLNKGIALRALGCYRDSIQCFETVMTISDYAQAQALVCMGVTYREAGNLAKAKACCITVLKADGEHQEARELLREILTQIQEQGSDQVAASPPVHRVVDMCLDKAQEYKGKGQFTLALQEVARGLAIVPHDTRLTLLQSSIYEYTGDLDRAIDVLLALGSGMAISKWDKLVYYALVRLFFLAGRIEEARGTLAVISSRKQEWEGVGGLSKYKTVIVMTDLIAQALSRDDHGNTLPASKGFTRRLHADSTVAVIGDSHVLSYAWQKCRVGDKDYTMIPFLVPGLKAWHVQEESNSIPHHALLQQLKGIAPEVPLLLVCGEIGKPALSSDTTPHCPSTIIPGHTIYTTHYHMYMHMHMHISTSHTLSLSLVGYHPPRPL
eukprot:TRINITY_DN15742_c0_g1_i1.p1 TRINITY_DN15742_c0_g1~~TRINITY_DN15742_c0_g1_i1.p1  ORF type:complete len:533 (+),score=61.01 TRINITY_DN15742_c0_g1_i1:129-1601(+)